MFGTGSKKMLNMLILELLKEYSDENHCLTQQEIIKLLKLNYGMECDRRSVKSNILSLKEMGYEISMENGCYLMEREFEDSELRMLIDSVLFSKNISMKQAKTLIEKLRKQSNKYFNAKVSHISNLPELFHVDNKQVMYSLDALSDAISHKKQVAFTYNEYDVDFRLKPKREEKYIVNPYQMVANNGCYYLIANYDKYDNISHYRIDRMTGVEVLNTNVKPMSEVEGMESGFNLPRHMAEHIYMFSGKSDNVKMRASKILMNELVDWFGKSFQILEDEGENIIISVFCNLKAMRFWAMQYGAYVEVISPKSLRKEMKESVQIMSNNYLKKTK